MQIILPILPTQAPIRGLPDTAGRLAGSSAANLAMPASVTVHADLSSAWSALAPTRVFAYTAHAARSYADVAYEPGDVLLFGPEPTGLPDDVLDDPHVTDRLRIPMIPGRRSLNLANAAAVTMYEAWRQHGYEGSV